MANPPLGTFKADRGECLEINNYQKWIYGGGGIQTLEPCLRSIGHILNQGLASESGCEPLVFSVPLFLS